MEIFANVMFRIISVIIILFSCSNIPQKLHAQENRDYILKVDFGPSNRQADFWFNWEEANAISKTSRFFPNIFNFDGFALTLTTDCGTSGLSNCNMYTRFRAEVEESILDPLVEDGLFVTARRLTFQLSGLASGSYDFKGYFHDALHSSDVRIAVRAYDARSPSGFLMNNAIRISTGRYEPTVSTFTFPIESDGVNPIYIVFTSNLDGFWLNGFELTRYHYRERNADGVEFIPPYRYLEALITAYLDDDHRWYGCIGTGQAGRTRLGYWDPDTEVCLSLGEVQGETLMNHKLIKFDPYFEWHYTQGQIPSSAVDFTQDTVQESFACMVQIDSGEYVAGVVYPNFDSSCLAVQNGQVLTFTSYWIFARK